MKLIDKSRLLDGLKKLKQNLSASPIVVIEDVESLIESLEVKEVDLEKGVKDYIYALPHSRTGIPGGWKCSWHEEEVIKIVRHFFELGLKTQKGE